MCTDDQTVLRREAFKDFKILTITSLYIRKVIIYALRADQARLVDQHNYNTRHRHNFQLQAHRLSLYEKKPCYRGAAFFNRLPEDLQKLQDKQFKKALSDWLLDRSIYTIQEFQDWRSL
ncbi:hypothetical protein J6590_006909 [Homalodisca vitripennis]|nr:hypothetical protein J6590_006909 [Homalodisca vitripennis]